MNESDFGQAAGPDDGWPFDEPDLDHGYPGLSAEDTGSRAQPYVERHHEEARGDGGPWGYPQNMTPPDAWPGPGTYVPDPGQRSGQYGAGDPAPRRTVAHRRTRRFSWRPVTITALLAAVIAAVTAITFPRTGPGTEAGPIATTTGGAGVMAGGRHPSPAPRPAVTMEQAEQVLLRYWKISNEANERRSDCLLATIEAGSSYRMDAGAYRVGRAINPSGAGYAPFTASRTAYYIPRQPADAPYPRWFAVAVTVSHLASPQQPTGSGYLVFSQASAGAAWKDVAEPDAAAGSGLAPQIATDAQGYAAQVSGNSGLSIAPGAVSQLTASALDSSDTAAIKVPGTLADEVDEAYWRSRLPAGSTDSDEHQAGAGPVFGLRTKDGGAVLFYSVSAQLTLRPPSGGTFELDIPGYYPTGQALTSAVVGYIEQFAAYVPPAGRSGWQIVADASGIASRG